MTRPARVIAVTPTQRDVVRELAADGASSREVAHRLQLTPRSVDEHILKVCRRAGLHSRLELVVALLRGHLRVHPIDRRTTEESRQP